MTLNNNKIILIYLICYLSLIFGFFFNEDFAFGFIRDYLLHLRHIYIFDESIVKGFLSYEEEKIPHSPIFMLYMYFIENFSQNNNFAKLINLHLCLFIPYFFYKALKIKYKNNFNSYFFLIPVLLFLSPYFRSGSIWIDDNLFAIIFFSISIYYFINFQFEDRSLKFVFLNTIFFALACYMRPIYCLFGFYFFLSYFNNLEQKSHLLYYIILNILLSLPAFYYVFILEINEWFQQHLFRENIITFFALSSSVLFFYFFPYIFYFIKENKIKKFTKLDFFIGFGYFVLLLLFFDYSLPYSGGIFYRIFNLITDSNLLFYFFSMISLMLFLKFILSNKEIDKNINDILLIFILVIFEFDGIIYHETYDPLLYLLIFLIFKNNSINNFIINIDFKKYSFLFIFSLGFYLLSIIKTFI